MSDERLVAIELTKVIAERRAGPVMTEEEVFQLYRQCLAVVREPAPIPVHETDPSKVALALLSIINAGHAGSADEPPASSEPDDPRPRQTRANVDHEGAKRLQRKPRR